MMFILCFALCFAFALCDYSSKGNRFEPRPFPEQSNNQYIPEMAALDEAKVREFFGRFCILYDANDFYALSDLYAEDVVFINSGNDIANKQDVMDFISKLMEIGNPCIERVQVISGDFYYPYYVGHSYKSDGYGGEVATYAFSKVLRLKEDGDYEIVLLNRFKLPENQDQEIPQPQLNGYGEANQQTNGYGQREEQITKSQKSKISRPLPDPIPKAKPRQLPLKKSNNIPQQQNGYGQRQQQPNGYGQIQQQSNGYGQRPPQTNGYN